MLGGGRGRLSLRNAWISRFRAVRRVVSIKLFLDFRTIFFQCGPSFFVSTRFTKSRYLILVCFFLCQCKPSENSATCYNARTLATGGQGTNTTKKFFLLGVLARPGHRVVAPVGQQEGMTAGVCTWFTYDCLSFQLCQQSLSSHSGVRQASVCSQHLIVAGFSSCCSCRAFAWGASESCCQCRVRSGHFCVRMPQDLVVKILACARCSVQAAAWANFEADWLQICADMPADGDSLRVGAFACGA